MTDDPLGSVIIPTYNAAATLAQCLQALQRQTYGLVEIIMVNSYSNDAEFITSSNEESVTEIHA
jgi:glycosyltransferase involved in cell wall biosynthesis